MEDYGFFPEHDVFIRNVALQIDVYASSDAMDVTNDTVNCWFSVENAYLIGQIIDYR